MEKISFEQIMKIIEELEGRVKNVESILSTRKIDFTVGNNSPLPQREESFREFYLRYGPPKKETDRTLVIFYFLESKKKLDSITINELAQGFKEVRETVPKNISDKMQLLHKSGFVSPRESLGRARSWEITMSGLKHLEALENGKEN